MIFEILSSFLVPKMYFILSRIKRFSTKNKKSRNNKITYFKINAKKRNTVRANIRQSKQLLNETM